MLPFLFSLFTLFRWTSMPLPLLYAYADDKNSDGDFDNTSACLSSITISIILSGDDCHLFRWRTLLPGLPWILEGIFTIYSSILLIVAKYGSLPPLYITNWGKFTFASNRQAEHRDGCICCYVHKKFEVIFFILFWGEIKTFWGGNKNLLSPTIDIINETLIWLLHKLIFFDKRSHALMY